MKAKVFENFNPNEPRTEGENFLLEFFKTNPRFIDWIIFEQPHINSIKPDFVLLHPQRGIIIIEVKDWNLKLDIYAKSGYVLGTDRKSYKKNPINQVENYKNSILKSELRNSVYLAENFKDYYGCVETIVYFHKASKDEALKFCKAENSHTKIWTMQDIEYIKNTKNHLKSDTHTYALSREKSNFNKDGLLEELVKELAQHLQYADYNDERKQPFILTKEQKELAKLSPGSIRRWSGVAGAGKSLILAEKCVKALKDNKRVLLLTFNITLRHYLRDLCSQQFGTAEYENERKKLREDLDILHFHDFLKSIMTEHEIEVDIKDYNAFAEICMNTVNVYLENHIKKSHFNYDYILIDEGQDFQGTWILFLKQFFTGKGELFIVYDKAQNLFDRGIWIEDPEEIRNIGFKGKPGTLKYTQRLPDTMVQKIHAVRQKLQIDAEDILIESNIQQIDFLQKACWYNFSSIINDEKMKKIEYYIDNLRQKNNWKYEDITILTTNENTGVEIVKYFEQKNIRTSHVYDIHQQKDIERRRSEKWKFHGGTGRLKVSSYQSYKGWQTPNIILVLDLSFTDYSDQFMKSSEAHSKMIKDALFISMSRIKGKAETEEYNFICLNYLPKYNHLISIFDDSNDDLL